MWMRLFLLMMATMAGAVETVLNVDTAQPKALLAYQTYDQGAAYDYRVNVKTTGMRATVTAQEVCVIQYATNAAALPWAIFRSTSVNTNTGSFLIPIDPLVGPLGDGIYQVYVYNTNTPSRKYGLGGGAFRIEETTGYGAPTAAYYTVPLNTDLIEQTGSNVFARMSDVSGSGGGITNVPPLDYTIITNPPWAMASTVDATNALFSAWFSGLQSRTSYWDTAYSWGDWSVAVGANTAAIRILETNTVTRAGTNGWETGSHAGLATMGDVAAAIAAIPAADAFVMRDSTDTNRWWRFEGTQAVQYALGALTTNYTVTLSADFEETVTHTRPAWTNNVFPFTDGDWVGDIYIDRLYIFHSGTINAAEWQSEGLSGYPNQLNVFSGAAQGTATVYAHPYFPTNATGNVIGPIPTNLVTYAQLLAWWIETGFAQIAASNALPYTAWTGTVTPADGTATVAIAHGNMPVLVTSAPCVLTLDPTGYGTAGVSRVSLSYYTGTNSFTFATNIIDYAETTTVDTNGWNTLLIRRVSDGAWKGVVL